MLTYQNILVIQTAFIGDAILASALLEKFHAVYPYSKISILVREGNEHIYRQHPYLHKVLVWHKKNKKIRNLLALVREVRAARFDCVVNCHRYTSSGIIAAFSGARHITGFKENPLSFMFNTTARHKIGDGRHETERYNSLISDFTGTEVFKPKLYPSAADKKKVAPLTGGNYVCMAPASVWFTKQLPPEKWTELCEKIPEDYTIYLLGAAADKSLCENIASAVKVRQCIVLAGELSLLQSCELMRHSKMNYVNDSAPLHLASAVNAPVTAFFCSTIPEFGFGPLSENARVFGVDKLPCRPCGLHGYRSCPLKHFRCGHEMPLPAIV